MRRFLLVSQQAAANFRSMTENFEPGDGLLVTDLQPADDFILLACSAFVSFANLSQSITPLHTAAFLLNRALIKSPHKYQFRLFLISIYRLLGASSLALQHYKLLKIRAIQFDTLSHVVITRGATFATAGGIGTDHGILGEIVPVDQYRMKFKEDCGDMCVKVINEEVYSKVEDYELFRDRIERSFTRFQASLELFRTLLTRGTYDINSLNDVLLQVRFLLEHESCEFKSQVDGRSEY